MVTDLQLNVVNDSTVVVTYPCLIRFVSAVISHPAFFLIRHFVIGAVVLALVLCALIIGGQSASANEQNEAVDFEADTVTVDDAQSILIATGNVRVTQAGDVLTADRVIYNRATDEAHAIGSVVYLTADGFEHRADEMQLTENFSHVIASPLISFFGDGTRFDARSGNFRQGAQTIFDRSRFSPCKCDYDKGESPIWDLRSTSSTHNPDLQTVIHNNVSMHIMGLPVFYFPIISHADWTVKRRSGFLSPSVQFSNDKGGTVMLPYYQILGPTKDIEFQATTFQFRGTGLTTMYRERWDNAELDTDVIIGKLDTFAAKRQNVAAIFSRFKADVGAGWDLTADILRSSQDTFLRRYGYHSSQRLNSKLRAEKLHDDRYYLVTTSDLQGLATSDTKDDETTVLPSVFFESKRSGFASSQKITTQLSALQLDNDESHEMVRWTHLSKLEDKARFGSGFLNGSAALLSSYYDIQSNATSTTQTSEFGQINSVISAGYRVPFAVQVKDASFLLEPRIQATFIAGSDRTDEVPNRDSSDFRLDEANIFLSNQFQGRDYILPGSHVNAGVTAISNSELIGDVSAFAGLSYRSSGKTPSGLTSDGSEKISDYVASVRLDTPYDVDLYWSGRASSHDFKLNESDALLRYNSNGTSISFRHKQVAKAYFSSAVEDKEEASLVISQKVFDDITVIADQAWNLSGGQTKRNTSTYRLLWSGGLQDCVTLSLDYKRDPFTDRDVKNIKELQLLITFKHLGSLPEFSR